MTTPTFEAQLYGDVLPPQGEAVRVELRSRAFVVCDSQEREEEVGYSALEVRSGGWHGGGLLLEWEGDRGRRSLAVSRAEAVAVLRDSAPEALRARIGTLQRPRRARRPALVFGLLAVVAGCALVVVTLFATSGRLVDAAVRRVPPAWEAKLGEATVAPFVASGRVRQSGIAVATLDSLGTRLAAAADSPYTFRWILVEDETVNAMAAPGGSIIVFTGMMRATDSVEELAGVLAHEMQHVLLRHSLRGLVRGLGLRALLSMAFGASDWGVLATAAERLGELRFSRRQESQADIEGVRLLERAGIGAQGMATFFEKLAERGREAPAFLSTHPASAERARTIRRLSEGKPAPPPLAYDWQQVRADLGHR